MDGADYFDVLQRAMLQSQQRIMLIGWDFDSRIKLSKGRRWWQVRNRSLYPRRLGSLINWLTRRNPNLMVHIIKWRFGAFKFLWRGSMMWDLLRWMTKRQVRFKLDAAHPFGCSQHQKIVVMDGNFAMCGGIDMTLHRWDTRDHREDDERRISPDTKSYGPWHDMALAMEGDVAEALDELGRDRWFNATGDILPDCKQAGVSAWPQDLAAEFENVEVGIARSRPA